MPDESVMREALERRYQLEQEASSIRLTLAVQWLWDDKWRAYSEYVWYRKTTEKGYDWKFNINDDMIHFGKGRGSAHNAFEWLLLAKEEGRLPGASSHLPPVEQTKVFYPDYVVTQLPKHLQAAHYRMPTAQDWLASLYGWDEDIKAFFQTNEEGDRLSYFMPGSFVVLADKRRYATWRVKSMLLFGNPYGFANAEQRIALLATAPNLDTGIMDDMLAGVPDFNARNPKLVVNINRARQLEAEAAAKEKASRPTYAQRTDAENKKRVEEIKAEQKARHTRLRAHRAMFLYKEGLLRAAEQEAKEAKEAKEKPHE